MIILIVIVFVKLLTTIPDSSKTMVGGLF